MFKKKDNRSGQRAEAYARKFLSDAGLHIVENNFRSPYGEIDIIAQDATDGTPPQLVFIEVRLRKHTQYGQGFETVNPQKQQKIIKTAHYFLQQKQIFENMPCRFDIVSLQSGGDNSYDHNYDHNSHLNSTPTWIKDAFQT